MEGEEEDQYGVSWEAPSLTSVAITLSPSHHLPPVFLSAICPPSVSVCQTQVFVVSSPPMNNSKSQWGQTVD